LEDNDIFDGSRELEEKGVECDIHVVETLRVKALRPSSALKKGKD
jgi:hypothetical protein